MKWLLTMGRASRILFFIMTDSALRDMQTPALLVDLDRMEANLERMAAFFRSVPAKLRPHFKNHKCPDLAWKQLDAGAIGITCATLREAESLVHHGVRSVLLANEIVD